MINLSPACAYCCPFAVGRLTCYLGTSEYENLIQKCHEASEYGPVQNILSKSPILCKLVYEVCELFSLIFGQSDFMLKGHLTVSKAQAQISLHCRKLG